MSLVRGADGNFYGTTLFGGADNQGVVLSVSGFSTQNLLTEHLALIFDQKHLCELSNSSGTASIYQRLNQHRLINVPAPTWDEVNVSVHHSTWWSTRCHP
jgi:uncharacterized repeat protein (TIGR03803 family)